MNERKKATKGKRKYKETDSWKITIIKERKKTKPVLKKDKKGKE